MQFHLMYDNPFYNRHKSGLKERELQETGLYPYFKKRKSNTSLLLYLEAYIGSQKQHKSNIALWRGLQKRLELVCSREMQFKDVNVAFCEQVLSSLIQGSTNGELKPLAPNTVKNYFSRFIRFLRHAKKEGLLKTVPKFQPVNSSKIKELFKIY